MKRLAVLLRGAELVTNHVVGKQHTIIHRRVIGSVIMAVGVGIAHLGSIHHYLISIPLDLVGYSLHAIGFVPFIKSIENANDN